MTDASGMPQQERTGVLVLRLWIEGPSGGGVRARITSEQQLGGGERISVVTDSASGVVEVVRRWVEDFIATSTDAVS